MLDVETGRVTPLVTQVLSDEFLFVQVFFDQYTESYRIWSPDSSQLVVTGAILEVVTVLQPGGAAELPEVFVSQVRVLDATGVEDPVSIGGGLSQDGRPTKTGEIRPRIAAARPNGGHVTPTDLSTQLLRGVSRSAESKTIVTGPAFSISTFIGAPNSPVATGNPLNLNASTSCSNMGPAISGRAASVNPGRRPLRGDA